MFLHDILLELVAYCNVILKCLEKTYRSASVLRLC
jgi:hypothetical protein